MSYTFLLEQAVESSAECFSDIAQFVLSRITSSVETSCFSGNEMESFRGFQSGMTFSHLTGPLGMESQTSSVADSHARTSPQPERVQASLTEKSQGSGVRWQELSVRYDRNSSSWKTHRCLWVEDLPWSSVTLPTWGSMRDGVLYQRQTPVLLTSENESGYWPSPTTKGLDGGSNSRKAAKVRGFWPTPTTRDRKQDAESRTGGPSLSAAVRNWPTTRALDGEKGARSATNSTKKRVETGKANLAEAVVESLLFATPTARDWRSGKVSQATMERNSRPLSEQIGGLLNPDWVEWLMGWPIGYSGLEPLAMDKFQQWWLLHGKH